MFVTKIWTPLYFLLTSLALTAGAVESAEFRACRVIGVAVVKRF